ncbi:hypothetical protein B0H12DRAFT_1126919 [Mycena haematopus]|nr:hypothetical protein B0H12DRAFT_1126919 [Mycena haematopus]
MRWVRSPRTAIVSGWPWALRTETPAFQDIRRRPQMRSPYLVDSEQISLHGFLSKSTSRRSPHPVPTSWSSHVCTAPRRRLATNLSQSPGARRQWMDSMPSCPQDRLARFYHPIPHEFPGRAFGDNSSSSCQWAPTATIRAREITADGAFDEE